MEKTKKKFNLIKWTIGLAVLIVGGSIVARLIQGQNVFTGENVTGNTVIQNQTEKPTEPVTANSISNTEAGKLWETWDWTTTTPGKALGEIVGLEWVNWVMWGAAILIVLIVLKMFLPGSKDKGSKKGGDSVVGWIAGVVIALGSVGIIAYFATSAVTTISGHINGNPVVQVDLSRSKETFGSQEGKTVTKKMDIRGEMAVRLRTINHTKEGRYSTWPCPSAPALKSVGVMYEIVRGGGSPVNVIALTAESQKKLFDMGIVSVDTSVTSVKAPYGGETPCQYLVDPRR